MGVIILMNNDNGIKLLDPSDIVDSVNNVNDVDIVIDNSEKGNDHYDKGMVKNFKFIKLKEDIYYGPKNINKNKFVRMYKKLDLVWIEGENIDGVVVDGWFSRNRSDRSQYIIKLPEEGGYKRFKFLRCNDIYSYFISLGAATFEPTVKGNVVDPGEKKSDVTDGHDDYRFIGADLWSGYRTRQLLRDMPMDWGVIWK